MKAAKGSRHGARPSKAVAGPWEPQKGNSDSINEGGGPPIAPEMGIYYAQRGSFFSMFFPCVFQLCYNMSHESLFSL